MSLLEIFNIFECFDAIDEAEKLPLTEVKLSDLWSKIDKTLGRWVQQTGMRGTYANLKRIYKEMRDCVTGDECSKDIAILFDEFRDGVKDLGTKAAGPQVVKSVDSTMNNVVFESVKVSYSDRLTWPKTEEQVTQMVDAVEKLRKQFAKEIDYPQKWWTDADEEAFEKWAENKDLVIGDDKKIGAVSIVADDILRVYKNCIDAWKRSGMSDDEITKGIKYTGTIMLGEIENSGVGKSHKDFPYMRRNRQRRVISKAFRKLVNQGWLEGVLMPGERRAEVQTFFPSQKLIDTVSIKESKMNSKVDEAVSMLLGENASDSYIVIFSTPFVYAAAKPFYNSIPLKHHGTYVWAEGFTDLDAAKKKYKELVSMARKEYSADWVNDDEDRHPSFEIFLIQPTPEYITKIANNDISWFRPAGDGNTLLQYVKFGTQEGEKGVQLGDWTEGASLSLTRSLSGTPIINSAKDIGARHEQGR